MTLGRFVSDWRRAHKWWSARLMAVLAVAPVVYENADFVQDFIPATTFHWVMGALGALALVSRIVRQS